MGLDSGDAHMSASVLMIWFYDGMSIQFAIWTLLVQRVCRCYEYTVNSVKLSQLLLRCCCVYLPDNWTVICNSIRAAPRLVPIFGQFSSP